MFVKLVIIILTVQIVRESCGKSLQIQPNPVIYAAGGDGDGECGPTENAVNIFDLTKQRWCLGSNLPQALAWYGSVYFQNLVYLVGGTTGWCSQFGNSNQTYVFDPFTNSYSTSTPLTKELYDVHAVVADNKIIITAPVSFSGQPTTAYILNGNQWQEGPQLAELIQQYALVTWKNTLWTLGGYLGNNLTSTTVKIWDMTNSNQWVTGPSMLVDRSNNGAAVIGNSIYVCGGDSLVPGQPGGYEPVNSCERLILNDDGSIEQNWTMIASIINTHSKYSLLAYNGTLLTAGSRSNINVPIEQYNPSTNTWLFYTTQNDQDTRAVIIDDFPASSMNCNTGISKTKF